MTDEQIELEFAHMALDKALRDGDKEEYKDPSYEEYDRETEEEDNILSYEYDYDPSMVTDEDLSSEDGITSEEPGDNGNEEDWEDVEIDVAGQNQGLPHSTE